MFAQQRFGTGSADLSTSRLEAGFREQRTLNSQLFSRGPPPEWEKAKKINWLGEEGFEPRLCRRRVYPADDPATAPPPSRYSAARTCGTSRSFAGRTSPA